MNHNIRRHMLIPLPSRRIPLQLRRIPLQSRRIPLIPLPRRLQLIQQSQSPQQSQSRQKEFILLHLPKDIKKENFKEYGILVLEKYKKKNPIRYYESYKKYFLKFLYDLYIEILKNDIIYSKILKKAILFALNKIYECVHNDTFDDMCSSNILFVSPYDCDIYITQCGHHFFGDELNKYIIDYLKTKNTTQNINCPICRKNLNDRLYLIKRDDILSNNIILHPYSISSLLAPQHISSRRAETRVELERTNSDSVSSDINIIQSRFPHSIPLAQQHISPRRASTRAALVRDLERMNSDSDGGSGNNKLIKYKSYLNKYDLEKLLKIANNKKIKITSKLSKKQIINKLIKFKFH